MPSTGYRHEDMPQVWRDMTGMNPSWMPRVIAILMEDHPDVWRRAWTEAISRNADEQAGAPAPCLRRHAHMPHRTRRGQCPGVAPEYPWEPVYALPDHKAEGQT